MVWLPDGEKSLMIMISFDTIPTYDMQTDRQTDIETKLDAEHRAVKCNLLFLFEFFYNLAR